MIKPDATGKKVIGRIISAVESEFDIIGIRMKKFTIQQGRAFYAVHKDKPFYDNLVQFITRGPVVGLLLEGENVIERVRSFIGATDPKKAMPGTIRSLYGTSLTENAVHASDSEGSAAYEIPFLFDKEDIP